MSDELLVVNFASLEHASGAIQSAIGTMNARLQELDTLGKRLSASWSGEAQEAYNQRQAAWQSEATNLTDILNSIRQAVDESAQQYLQTENRNKSLFQ